MVVLSNIIITSTETAVVQTLYDIHGHTFSSFQYQRKQSLKILKQTPRIGKTDERADEQSDLRSSHDDKNTEMVNWIALRVYRVFY